MLTEQQDQIEKKYFTIGEVADLLKVNQSLIRFWEKEFPEFKPRKTDGGTRKFHLDDIATLQRIYQLVKVEGFTLAGAKEKMKEKENTDLRNIRIKLTALRNFLQELKDQI